MAGNILYGIKEYSIGAIKILAKVLITICQLLLEIIKILFIICGTVLKMFLAVFFIGRKKNEIVSILLYNQGGRNEQNTG